MLKKNIKLYLVRIFFLVIILFSIIIRAPKQYEENYIDSDATYHVLLTLKAYEETPVSIHKFLPLTSLGGEENKNINWGATVPDKYGNYYYTSFSAAGFFVPYIFMKIFNLDINKINLYIFNSILYIMSVILLISLFKRVFKDKISDSKVVIFTTVIYSFQLEIMHSQGIVYWHQSLFQVLFLTQILMYLDRNNKLKKLIFYLLCIINPYVEWTGYVANLGFIIVTAMENISTTNKGKIRNLIFEIACTILSFTLFSLHYLLVIGKDEYFATLKSRFLARSVGKSSVASLLTGYWESYKYLLILVFILFFIILFNKFTREELIKNINLYKKIIFLLSFPIVENILMMEHATAYTYDRMKAIFILICLMYIFYISILIRYDIKYILFIVISITAIINCYNYYNYSTIYKWKINYIDGNEIIAKQIKEEFNKSNSILVQPTVVRGYDNLLFERGIHEASYAQSYFDMARNKNIQYIIEFNLKPQYRGVDEYLGYAVYDTINYEQKEITLQGKNIIEKSIGKNIIRAANINDVNWNNGISTKSNIILFENTDYNRKYLENAKKIQHIDIIKDIERVEEINEAWIYVYVYDKKQINNFEFPNKIELIK